MKRTQFTTNSPYNSAQNLPDLPVRLETSLWRSRSESTLRMADEQTQVSYRRFTACLLIAVAVVAAIYAAIYTRPWESAIERAP